MVRVAAMLTLLSCFSLSAQLSPPLITLPDTNGLGLHIPRSLRLLSTNTAIRIATCGQSIIDGNNKWHVRLMDSLRVKFGNTHVTHLPHGVGACATDCQLTNHVASIAADNPDLCIYYVYGWENYDRILYEINRLCANDSLEFLILNDHITPPSADVHGTTYAEYMNRYFLPWMCEKWQAGLCDIRTPWAQYLADYGYPAARLLSDDVHLNDSGQWLMEDLVERYFVIRGADTRAPVVDSVVCVSPTRIKVCFSEKIERSSATAPGNYVVGGAQVDGVVFGGDLRSVFLSTGVRSPGQYSLTVNGVLDIAGNTIASTTRQFESIADPGWQSMDIGMCASPGTTLKDEGAGTWRLTSTADNTWAYKNEYHYAYRTVYGDFTLLARLASHGASPANQNAWAGVCIREFPEYYARSMGVGIRASGALTYFLRQNERDTLLSRSGVTRSTPQWFRIRRENNLISMHFSDDGATWSAAPTATWLTTSEVTVGMFALAGNYGSTETANFTDVSLSGGTVPVVRPRAAEARAGGVMRVRVVNRELRLSDMPAGSLDIALHDARGRVLYRARATGPACSVRMPAGGGAARVLVVTAGAVKLVQQVAMP